MKNGTPLDIFGGYLKTFQRHIIQGEVLLFKDNKLITPAALRSPFLSFLHETHPGQIGMKALAEKNWWPHLYRELYFHLINCTQHSSFFWVRQTRKNYRNLQNRTKKLILTSLVCWIKFGALRNTFYFV